MSELEQKILDEIKLRGQYDYSSDMSIKHDESKCVDSLETKGCIRIKGRTIGYVIADAF